ncbi:MAG: hypothetical protein KDD34_08705 [Bdellovibrionales bacterium]|nr:hypothetical protein [Bdellovibrionales bacterium]
MAKRQKKQHERKDPESELREVLRQFARTVLKSQNSRETAAKKVGLKPSYLNAMLKQKSVGGLGAWSTLILYCFETLGIDALSELSNFLKKPELIAKGQSQTPSEIVFRNLDKISIVNEDVKFQFATHLQKMLADLEKSIEKQR